MGEIFEHRPFDGVYPDSTDLSTALEGGDGWLKRLDLNGIRERLLLDGRGKLHVVLCNTGLISYDMVRSRSICHAEPHPCDAIANRVQRNQPYLSCSRYENEEAGVVVSLDPEKLRDPDMLARLITTYSHFNLNMDKILSWMTDADYKRLILGVDERFSNRGSAQMATSESGRYLLVASQVAEDAFKILLRNLCMVLAPLASTDPMHTLGNGRADHYDLAKGATMVVGENHSVQFFGLNKCKKFVAPDWEVDAVTFGQKLCRLFEVTIANKQLVDKRLKDKGHRPERLIPYLKDLGIDDIHRFFIHITDRKLKDNEEYKQSSSPEKTRIIRLSGRMGSVRDLTDYCIEEIPEIGRHFKK